MPIHPSSPNAPLLLFDFGGVIVDLDREQVLRSFDQLGIDIRPYLGTFKQSGIFSQLEQGRISIHDFCTALRLAKLPTQPTKPLYRHGRVSSTKAFPPNVSKCSFALNDTIPSTF